MKISKKRKNDLILVASLLAVLLAVYAVFSIFTVKGEYVRVTVNGKEYGTYALSTDLKLEIAGNTEGRVNILVIKNGEAYVDYADCPDPICARHRPIKNVGDSIVCLPNKVVVTVIGNGGKVDTVS